MRQVALTYEQAVEALRAAVSEKGYEYVYDAPTGDGCAYFHGQQPGCIVGHVLAQHGVTREDLRVGDDDLNYGNGVSQLVSKGILDVDNRTHVLLERVQDDQDNGAMWGPAVDEEVALS